MEVNKIKAKVFMPLTKGKVTKVDFSDWYLTLRFIKWNYGVTSKNRGYARSGAKTVYMHRLITNCASDLVVDHIDGDTMNNTKNNLRVCRPRDNSSNRSRQKNNSTGYKGVRIDKRDGVYMAEVNGEYLGRFKTAKEAALAYNKRAVELSGEFACINEISH